MTLAKKGVDIPPTLPYVFENYIKTKCPPFADLASHPQGDSRSGEGDSLRQLEDAYNRASTNSNANIQKYRQENESFLDRERTEVVH